MNDSWTADFQIHKFFPGPPFSFDMDARVRFLLAICAREFARGANTASSDNRTTVADAARLLADHLVQNDAGGLLYRLEKLSEKEMFVVRETARAITLFALKIIKSEKIGVEAILALGGDASFSVFDACASFDSEFSEFTPECDEREGAPSDLSSAKNKEDEPRKKRMILFDAEMIMEDIFDVYYK